MFSLRLQKLCHIAMYIIFVISTNPYHVDHRPLLHLRAPSTPVRYVLINRGVTLSPRVAIDKRREVGNAEGRK